MSVTLTRHTETVFSVTDLAAMTRKLLGPDWADAPRPYAEAALISTDDVQIVLAITPGYNEPELELTAHLGDITAVHAVVLHPDTTLLAAATETALKVRELTPRPAAPRHPGARPDATQPPTQGHRLPRRRPPPRDGRPQETARDTAPGVLEQEFPWNSPASTP